MSAHTPGPWVLNGVMAMDTRLWIVSIPGEQARIEVADYSTESEANAHLIAAAPSLLAALERVGCQDVGSCGPNEPDGLCFVCTVIAKSRGGK